MDPDDDPALMETQSPALAVRPVPDARARDVARAKVANALFANHEPVKLGRYHLIERVGQGGMGVVWGAFDPELERRVAIKLVRAKAEASRERILLEGQALAKLSHPNVVAVHDVGVVDDEVFLVMEWIRGKNLRVYCAEPRSIREIVALYRAAGEGLYAAHRAGLVHRDFKPENVMLGEDGRVRVLDFGLALDREDGDDGAIAGTPKYMAPEQQRGEDVTERADQFAFGVALREALVARNADKREAPVPGWLEAIVARARSEDPANRFATMHDLLRVLGRDPAKVWGRRVLVGGAVAAAVAAFAIGSLRARGPRVWTATTEALLPSYDEDTYPPVISPDGSQIAYSSDRGRPGWYRLYVAPLRGGNAREIALPENVSVAFPRWSDGGRAIVYTNIVDDFTAYRVWLDGGPPERLAGPGVFVDGCGDQILLARLGAPDCTACERLILRSASGTEREVFRVEGEYIANSARCDRAGRRVVFSRRRFDDAFSPAELWLVDLESGAPRQLTNDGRRNARPAFHPDGQSIVFSSDRSGSLDLYEVSIAGGVATRLTSSASNEVGVDITPDGQQLLFNVDETASPLFARDLTGASRTRITPTRPNLRLIHVTPDGREVVGIDATGTRRVVAIDLSTGAERTIAPGTAVSVTATDYIYASAEPTTIYAVPRARGTPRALGTLRGQVEAMRPGPDGFLHMQVLNDGERAAWRMPLSGGSVEREAPPPWCFIQPAPLGGWRVARRCPADGPPVSFLVAPGADVAEAGSGWISTDGDWDARGETYISYDVARIRRVTAATNVVENLFEVPLAVGVTLSPDGKTVYLAEYGARVHRYLMTNFAARPRRAP